ncbi:MAG: VTT domain-containing protein, partial [Prolixibacteraceae bacterium]|nr:VTT domain-containing protein [Prolixibacteraceae bacterium]
MAKNQRLWFFLKNIAKGLAGFAVVILIYLLFIEFFFKNDPDAWMEKFYSRPTIIYAIYFASEFFFGIIPPEFFMIWALHKGGTLHYVLNVFFFAVVSYVAGYSMFIIGKLLNKRLYAKLMERKFFGNLFPMVKKYGLFLVIVAAFTPLPYSATSLVVGASGYSQKNFLIAALSRFARYAMYGFIVYQTH